jgi:hypothetical protein
MARTKIDGEGQIAEESITGGQVKDESIESRDIKDGTVGKSDLNVTSTGEAVVTKVLAGSGISILYDGIDVGTGTVTVSLNTSTGGINSAQHKILDQLVHELAETSYCEIERTNGRVSSVIYYETAYKLKKIREITYLRTSGRIVQTVIKQYDSSGVLIVGETLTGTITRTLGRVSSIDWVLS